MLPRKLLKPALRRTMSVSINKGSTASYGVSLKRCIDNAEETLTVCNSRRIDIIIRLIFRTL